MILILHNCAARVTSNFLRVIILESIEVPSRTLNNPQRKLSLIINLSTAEAGVVQENRCGFKYNELQSLHNAVITAFELKSRM